MNKGLIRKPVGRLAMLSLAAAGALALFAFSSGDSAYAASSVDDSHITPIVFNAPGDWDCNDHNGPPGGNNGNNGHDCDNNNDHNNDDCDRDWDHNGPPGNNNNHGNDDCDHNNDHGNDDCDHNNGHNGPPSRGNDRDNCDRNDDRDNCDRNSRDRNSRDRDRCNDRCDDNRDRNSRDRNSRDRDNCDDEESEITIIKNAEGTTSNNFSFGGDLGSFNLKDNQSRSFTVDAGYYTVWENEEADWDLQSVNCSGDGIITPLSNGVRIRVSEDDHVTCVFNNIGGTTPIKIVSPAVAPQPQIIYVPVPAPAPVARPVEVVREPAPAPRPVQAVAALPRTGEGLDFQREGGLALPLGALAALTVAGFGYLAVRRVRDTD